MSWFGGGLSNLQGKITSFTAQVLSDVAETVQGNYSLRSPPHIWFFES